MPEESALALDAYLDRLGVSRSSLSGTDRASLRRLQQAHIRSIPFETLSITGDPYGPWPGRDISLAIPDIYRKIVGNQRGGFCYELNGLFSWGLEACGYDRRRVAARIRTGGSFGPPADHLTIIVELDQPYLVDVGLGLPKLRRPLPLDGSEFVDAAGAGWRTRRSNRPDADFAVECKKAGDDDWRTRCIVRDDPREMDYFSATCDYFQRAPESHFTGDPMLIIATADGHVKLTPDTLTRSVGPDIDEQAVAEDDWYRLLADAFNLDFPPDPGGSAASP